MSPTKRKSPATKKKPSSKKSVAKKKPAAKKTSAAKKVSKSATTKTAGKTTTKGFFDPNVEVARELASIAENHAVSELIYETNALTVTIRRGEGMIIGPQMVAGSAMVAQAPIAHAAIAPAAPAQAAAPAAAEPAGDDHLHSVTSPFVGTFYRAPNPDSPSYVEPGQHVEKGQALCIVEAMKLMNEIEADVTGTISAILVKNAESVEYGQPLFKIDPA